MQTQRANINVTSIQKVLEKTFETVVKHPVKLVLSSRTDKGVHALESTAQVDIPEDVAGRFRYSSPEKLCYTFNSTLDKSGEQIRIRRIVEVPLDFHCRYSASSRSYCYRLAVCKEDSVPTRNSTRQRPRGALPIRELYGCQLVHQPFDVRRVSEACSVFLGTWNFRTFAHDSKDFKQEGITEEYFVKTLRRFSLSKIKPDNFVNHFDPISNNFDFYDINIEGSGFLRRQVRRIVGSLISYGQGVISYEDILYMLKNPSPQNWNPKSVVASSHGLFLKSVNYKEIPVLRGPFI